MTDSNNWRIALDQDRRQFYRIDKWVALEFQLLQSSNERTDLPNSGTFKVSPHFMLHAELQQLNTTIDKHLASALTLSPETTEIFNLLNRKINIIARSLTDSNELGFNIRTDKVNLSEGGLSIHLEEPLPLGQRLVIKLIMPESNVGMRLLSEVKRCELKESQFDIGLEFLNIPEICRSELARLIFRSQIEQHQAQKESQHDDETP